MIHDKRLAQLFLFAYGITVASITFVHQAEWIAALLPVWMVLSGRFFVHILKHTIRAIFVFNAVVSISFIALRLVQGEAFAETIILLNTRVFTITWLTFLLMHRVNLLSAFSFSPTLQFFITLTWSQYSLYRGIYQDFQLALESRHPGGASLRKRYLHLAATLRHLLERSLVDAGQKGLAMRSRCFFHEEQDLHAP